MVNKTKIALGFAYGAVGVLVIAASKYSSINKFWLIIPGLLMMFVGLGYLVPMGMAERTGGK
jgi:sulfite exporter TauE/SafE